LEKIPGKPIERKKRGKRRERKSEGERIIKHLDRMEINCVAKGANDYRDNIAIGYLRREIGTLFGFR
jgi:hypothetical protein